jgi:hypothetical protein
LSIALSGLNQIVFSWRASQGASSYIVERSPDGITWSTIATGVTSTSFVDSGLHYSTIYDYRTLAVSSGGISAASGAVGAVTLAAPPDALAGQSLVMYLTRGVAYTGPVATFVDANAATSTGNFAATINWGNGRVSRGTVSGSNGTFTVIGVHTFTALGNHLIHVTVTMTGPERAAVVVTSTAEVSVRPKRRPSIRARPVVKIEKKHPPVVKKRAH